MRSTIELLLDLVRQSQQLARVEFALVRAEISERGGLVASSLVALAAGLVLLPVGLGLILVAFALLLARLGLPLDLAFLILALAVIAAGLLLAWAGVRGLKPSRLVPAKSISQISSLIGGLEP
jgi:Putative Actinobacterial Holin-X, holin superfamily III